MDSQVVTVAAGTNGAVTATATKATAVDVVTTVFSTNSALTGLLGLGQRAGLFVGGMAVQSKLKRGTFNFLKD